MVLAASGATAAAAETAEADGFGRYAVILERKPFGMPPAAPAMPVPPAIPQDSFTTYVRLTALMQEDGGALRVGFVDKKQKDKVYMLGVGESADDYQVLDADLSEELAKIRKGTEEQWLSMKTPGVAGPPKRAATESTPQPVRTADIRPGPAGPTASAEKAPALPPNLAGLRRASRYAAIRRAEIEREKLEEDAKRLGVFREPPPGDGDEEEEDLEADDTAGVIMVEEDDDEEEYDEDEGDEGDEVLIPFSEEDDEEEDDEEEDEEAIIREAEIQAHLQNYQKELIRQGLPPLPIPLTAKTDSELVAEGVLPPMPAPGAEADGNDGEE